MEQDEVFEELKSTIEGASNFMRGMLFDPEIPDHAKEAMREKISDLEKILFKH